MLKNLFKVISYFFLASYHEILKPPVPNTKWVLFDSPDARPLQAKACKNLEGVYAIEDENDFGEVAVLKWSMATDGAGSTHYLSIFCKEEAAYFICRGKELNGSVLLNGYWRKAANRKTGKARFRIDEANGVKQLLSAQEKMGIVIEGLYGNSHHNPDKKISLKYLRPLYNKTPFEIIAHRGGGRNEDLLPASENSMDLIQMASRFGATGVEIDVQQSSDGMLVLYHDEKINNRLVQQKRIKGKLKEHSYAELVSKIKLKNGERISRLDDVLNAIVYKTDLRYVWLDVKDTGYLQKTRELQEKALKEASAAGRKLEITIGIHDEDLFKKFISLPGYQNIPSLCELDPEYVIAMHARIWAPMWTGGLQKEEVQKIQALGKRAFVWTIDDDTQINEFMNHAAYDGIVSNYPSLVAYYYYTKQ